ncbi:MAG: biotin--[Clostridia bacterium]|nr:biotin--[acetyl-CoA-carboxylase] ligase [Clostridia bacterium]
MLDSALLQKLIDDGRVRVLDETLSTNRDARDWLMDDAQHGEMVIASRQTGGRGRLGRSFSSPEGGLYMSLILKTTAAPGAVTTLCAVSVRRAILKLTGIETDIKWVNDLLLDGKKICGILCESAFSGSESLGMIAGIGVNVYGNQLPTELQDIARSVYPDHAHAPIRLEALAAFIRAEILAGLAHLPAHMDEYRQHCITLGKAVYRAENGETHEGQALDTTNEGALIIRENGILRTIGYGEVSIRPI